MSTERGERLEAEISLLEAMYPDQLKWDSRTRILDYASPGRSLQLMIPDGYPGEQLPTILSATVDREDVKEQMRLHIQACPTGEEILDSIILAFTEISLSTGTSATREVTLTTDELLRQRYETAPKATTIIWLHHLLNTNKRKQALSPSSSEVSGVTKPGYPGVLVYAGPAKAVNEHVNELKQLNWQAFQVRFEGDEEWMFAHGAGVKEVESMKDVVNEIGEANKAVFLEAMRMK